VESLDDFVPGLTEAFCEPGESEPVEFGKFIVPKTFRAIYLFTDRKDEKWIVTMTVSISDLGTPVLDSVEISGNVTRTKLKIVEEYRYLLLELSLKIVIKTRIPTFRDISERVFTDDFTKDLLANGSVVMDASNYERYLNLERSSKEPELVRWWTSNPDPLTRAELQELNKTINTALRRRITPEYLQHIAKIYTQAVLDGKNPIQTIMDSERVKHRTASDYATKARARHLLPETDPGVVTIEKPKSSTTEQKRKGKNGK
tara:strand:- start:592 stop:1368 length:777 start_codon:yes stop_codon:yes gene_type:complete